MFIGEEHDRVAGGLVQELHFHAGHGLAFHFIQEAHVEGERGIVYREGVDAIGAAPVAAEVAAAPAGWRNAGKHRQREVVEGAVDRIVHVLRVAPTIFKTCAEEDVEAAERAVPIAREEERVAHHGGEHLVGAGVDRRACVPRVAPAFHRAFAHVDVRAAEAAGHVADVVELGTINA